MAFILAVMAVVSIALAADYVFRKEDGNLGEAMAGLAAAFAALSTLLIMFRQIMDQQVALSLQTRLMGATALVEAENSKIAEAKAIIETLWRGEDVPLRQQEMPIQYDIFDQLERQLEIMISDAQQRACAVQQLRAWKKAAQSRATAIGNLEALSREASRRS
jgi:hypothetical protein